MLDLGFVAFYGSVRHTVRSVVNSPHYGSAPADDLTSAIVVIVGAIVGCCSAYPHDP